MQVNFRFEILVLGYYYLQYKCLAQPLGHRSLTFYKPHFQIENVQQTESFYQPTIYM